MIPVLEENFDPEFEIPVTAGTTEMESTWIFWIKITDKLVPYSCFDLTFDIDFIQISLSCS